ncbi:MAG: hypothetical protein AAGK22_10160 [Acidobacteriota bacterium]
MQKPIIGWHRSEPPPDGHEFAPHLRNQGGRLHWEGIDLAGLHEAGPVSGLQPAEDQSLTGPLPSPLEIAYLPRIAERIRSLEQHFAQARRAADYAGEFLYCYASKANTAEEIVRTTLLAGAHHEMSSRVDVEIARLMAERGHLPADRWILANGFKPAGSDYSEALLDFARSGAKVLPIFDDLHELEPFLEAGVAVSVGLRHKTYGLQKHSSGALDSRFGLSTDDLQRAAREIAGCPHLTLRMHHAMLGSQMVEPEDFSEGLEPALEDWSALRKVHETLDLFNFGGGIPARMTLDFVEPHAEIARAIVTTAKAVARRRGVPEPHLVGEMGRYTTAEHAAHLFEVLEFKDNGSPLPWALIDGSIMTSFPDIWAIGEHFAVLPLNHLDRTFRQVRLGGITCDSDDVYPQRQSSAELYLPAVGPEESLRLGFFYVGAYQEMLGGVRGSKHCVLPEACELLIEEDGDGALRPRLIEGHRTIDVLANLGYV